MLPDFNFPEELPLAAGAACEIEEGFGSLQVNNVQVAVETLTGTTVITDLLPALHRMGIREMGRWGGSYILGFLNDKLIAT